MGGLAPGGGMAVFIPCTDLPPVDVERLKRLAGVESGGNGFGRGGGLSGVPAEIAAGKKTGAGGGDADLVSGLADGVEGTGCGAELPTEAGMVFGDGERIGCTLAEKGCGGGQVGAGILRRGRGGCRGEECAESESCKQVPGAGPKRLETGVHIFTLIYRRRVRRQGE